MSDQIAPRNGSDDRELVRRTIAQGATDAELDLYFYDCHRRGVHPLDKLIHFTKRAGKYVPVTSIDFLRSRAADSEQLAGSDDAIFVEGKNGGPPLSASVTVYRLTHGQRFPYTATARWSEYNPGGGLWQKMPHVMLAKCAEALALRKAFPQELAGLYTGEEMAQAGRDAPARENPHVNRPEDFAELTEEQSAGLPSLPVGEPPRHQLKVKDQNELFGELNNEMMSLATSVELRAWGKSCKNEVAKLREDKRKMLGDLWQSRLHELLLAEEAEMPDPASEQLEA